MLNLRYVGGDGRLKTLNFAIQSKAHLDCVLTLGERDGSSPFSFVEATSSPTCNVVPRPGHRVQPFLRDPHGGVPVRLLRCERSAPGPAPQEIPRKAPARPRSGRQATLEAPGELEYYLFSPRTPGSNLSAWLPRAYRSAEDVRTETLLHLVSGAVTTLTWSR